MLLFAQWDYQIKTFRAEKGGVIYGNYTGEYTTPQALNDALGGVFTKEQMDEMQAQHDSPN